MITDKTRKALQKALQCEHFMHFQDGKAWGIPHVEFDKGRTCAEIIEAGEAIQCEGLGDILTNVKFNMRAK